MKLKMMMRPTVHLIFWQCVSSYVDEGKVFHCGLCLGLCEELITQVSWQLAILVHSQCVLAGLWRMASWFTTN